jgi:hypothetical protein
MRSTAAVPAGPQSQLPHVAMVHTQPLPGLYFPGSATAGFTGSRRGAGAGDWTHAEQASPCGWVGSAPPRGFRVLLVPRPSCATAAARDAQGSGGDRLETFVRDPLATGVAQAVRALSEPRQGLVHIRQRRREGSSRCRGADSLDRFSRAIADPLAERDDRTRWRRLGQPGQSVDQVLPADPQRLRDLRLVHPHGFQYGRG